MEQEAQQTQPPVTSTTEATPQVGPIRVTLSPTQQPETERVSSVELSEGQEVGTFFSVPL
jgi:hypothetical protein